MDVMAHSTPQPHPDQIGVTVGCAVITVSDTRSPETDHSGHLIQAHLTAAGHSILAYHIVQDEPAPIRALLTQLATQPDLDAVICNGGTGIAPRDTTYEAIEQLLEKALPGFGEIFRFLSYQEIGSRAIASRATAGIYSGKLLFAVPGSTNAVRLAMQQLILPELVHLVRQLRDH